MSESISDHHQIKTVSSFKELINREFQGDNNAICWQRNLVGDFGEIVSKLELKNNITEVSVEDLENLTLTDHGELAIEIIINDLKLLTDFGASPSLNLIKNYEILTRTCLENHFIHGKFFMQACFIRKNSRSPGCVSGIAEVWFLYICEIL